MQVRIVLQAYDHETMQKGLGSAKVILSEAQQRIIKEQSGAEDVTKWAAETLMSALNCLEDIQNGNS